ncbi:MAG: DUF2079 domain-containing protein [Oscillospiraceae bacterium]|jgi:uncharacterized membrane protein|nr:DUF2079 domain-containing protein [Oscillospiraceae bacterium]
MMNKLSAAVQSKYRELQDILRDGGWLCCGAGAFFTSLLLVLAQNWLRGCLFVDLDGLTLVNWFLFIGVGLLSFALIMLLCYAFAGKTPAFVWLTAIYVVFAMALSLQVASDLFLAVGLCVPLFFIVRCAVQAPPKPKITVPAQAKRNFGAAILLFAVFTAVLSYESILRYRIYSATNFDLGLFAQMFEYLRTTGHALTTLERNTQLSHFGIHCSPIFYLLLPFYCIVPRVETLLVLQAAAIGAGVFPVLAIAKRCFGAPSRLVVPSMLLYLLHPSIAPGLLYDFHENSFLAVFLLWALYFLIKQKTVPLFVFAVLTLSVKEDAAVYVFCLGLFGLLHNAHGKDKKQILRGAALTTIAIAWFAGASMVVRHYGDGVMVSRLRNYFPPSVKDAGFADVILVVVSNFGFVLKEAFASEKAIFLLWMFLPLGFAPFFAKKIRVWVLALPLFAVNLLSNYEYQHEIGYQYTFGSGALLIAVTLFALKDMKADLRRKIAVFGIVASLFCTVPFMADKIIYYHQYWAGHQTDILQIDQALDAIPQDATVTATTYLTPRLANRKQVYMYPNYYAEQTVTAYFVCTPEEVAEDPDLAQYIADNYTLVDEKELVSVYAANNIKNH